MTERLPHPHDEFEACPGGCDDVVVVENGLCQAKRDIDDLHKRVQASHDQLVRFEARLDEGGQRMGRIEVTIAANSSKLDLNTTETTEILNIMREGETFFRMARRIGEAVKWLAALALPLVGLWYAFKDHYK